MSIGMLAGIWGLVAGSALLIGATLGYFTRVSQRLVAAVMAFGSGVLISALSFELMDKAYQRGGFDAAATGFLSGAAVYTAANVVLALYGGKHRKRSGDHMAKEKNRSGGSGLAIALGSLLDGIPESIVIGLSLIGGGGVSTITVIAIFLSNLPEGLSSTVGMKRSGRPAGYIFGVWGSIAIACGIASLAGYTLFRNVSDNVVAATSAVAAGAILAMISDTMIPEAFEVAHNFAGLITVCGFLISFVLSKLSE